METKQKTNSGRRSAIDIVIVLLLLVAIGGSVFRWIYGVMQEEKSMGATYEVTFEVVETKTEVLECFRDECLRYADDKNAVYDIADPDCLVGCLVEDTFKITPYEDPSRSGLSHASGTLLCVGALSGDSLQVYGGERYLSRDTEIMVCSERALLTLRITKIVPAET